MCGVVAMMSAGAPVSPMRLAAAAAALHHRGPDGRGRWRSADGRVALAHTRLAVVGIADGAQPLVSADGHTVVVVNGELYDDARLRRELGARGHRFRSASDSEIALHLYEEHGEDFVHHLRGEFAIVVWDARRRRLLAVRDRFGIKPLCYTRIAADLACASEAKALLALGAPAAWDHEAAVLASSHQYLPPDRTLFRGIAQLPPGHMLLAPLETPGVVTIRRWWDLDWPRDGDTVDVDAGGAMEPAARQLRAHLDDAVTQRLRGDVPVACYLSGGLDSSAVAALAARRVATLDCFGISFAHAPYDEQDHARAVARHIGARFHRVEVSQRALVEALPEAVYFSEGLAINGQLAAKHALARAVHQAGYRVVLTGEGADEVLCGYAHLRRDYLLTRAAAGDTAADAMLASLTGERAIENAVMLPTVDRIEGDPGATLARALGHLPSFAAAKLGLGGRMAEILAPPFARRLAGVDRGLALLTGIDRDRLAGRHPADQSAYLWTKLAMAGYILRTLGDGTEMASSVEGRVPLLDHPLVEYVQTLPVALRAGGSIEKRLLRHAVADLLPEAVLARPKHPLLAPPITAFGGTEVMTLVQDVLRSRAVSRVPFLDHRRVRTWLDALQRADEATRRAADPVLMMALCATVLAQRFDMGEGS